MDDGFQTRTYTFSNRQWYKDERAVRSLVVHTSIKNLEHSEGKGTGKSQPNNSPSSGNNLLVGQLLS